MAPSGAAVVAPAVSPADLRAKLYASLTSAGVVDGLKTHLRSQLLSNLQATSPQVTQLSIDPRQHLISSTTRPSPAPFTSSQRFASTQHSTVYDHHAGRAMDHRTRQCHRASYSGMVHIVARRLRAPGAAAGMSNPGGC